MMVIKYLWLAVSVVFFSAYTVNGSLPVASENKQGLFDFLSISNENASKSVSFIDLRIKNIG